MDEVKVTKVELLKKLKDNRSKHVQLYNDALEGFYVDRKKVLEKAMAKISKNETPSTSIQFIVPVNHEQQYDEAIAMLEMSVDKIITLSRHEFSQYVQDTWVTQNEKNFMRAMALSSSNAETYR